MAVSVHDGPDAGQISPAIEQIEQRYAVRLKTLLADCGFCDTKDISRIHSLGVTAIIPSNNEAKKGDLAYASTYRQNLPGITGWRARMVKPETKQLYKLRCRIECVFAHLRNRGFRLLRLRGKTKVKAEVLIHLIANNILAGARLRLAAT